VRPGLPLAQEVIRAALSELRSFQPLSRATHGAHAAAWVDPAGCIVAVREDVGRHNALDKLIGARARGVFSAADGFCLITSRCSFEMAQKAIQAGFATLASVSAPTALAVRTAAAAGLALYGPCGSSFLQYRDPIGGDPCVPR
jgi:FdhD protein